MKFKCPICLKWYDWEDGEFDHIIPKYKGGSNDPSNLRKICIECHECRHVVDDGFSILEKYPNSGHRNEKDRQLNFFYNLFKPNQPK